MSTKPTSKDNRKTVFWDYKNINRRIKGVYHNSVHQLLCLHCPWDKNIAEGNDWGSWEPPRPDHIETLSNGTWAALLLFARAKWIAYRWPNTLHKCTNISTTYSIEKLLTTTSKVQRERYRYHRRFISNFLWTRVTSQRLHLLRPDESCPVSPSAQIVLLAVGGTNCVMVVGALRLHSGSCRRSWNDSPRPLQARWCSVKKNNVSADVASMVQG